MWMEKIRRGVLQVETDGGLRFVKPSLGQRLQLLWTFRNFNVLPADVLRPHERQLIDRLCQKSRLIRSAENTAVPGPVIGTLELAPPRFPSKKAPHSILTSQRNSA